MADIQLVWSCVFILTIVSMSYSDESCGDVKITSPVSSTVNVSVNDWLKMTFTFNTEKCTGPAYVISVEKKEQDSPMIVCRIHHNQTSCYKTGHEALYSCRCVSPSGPVQFWEKLERPGDVEYRWRWKDESGKQGEKNITFHITTGDKKNTQRFQTMKFILGGTGGLLLIVIAVVFISARCHKSRPSASTENRKGQHTPLDNVQLTRPNPQTQAPVAVEITDKRPGVTNHS
ncbi:uncharacterized protein LOC112569254 isoform X2 [Pomacea canaliculata]|uniref:uncharacterized protein LOC112569254 isoform X2 n=1 Tax=Pomacea canaliculata TaxID=400727 RepID=UPI000D738F83|nr:uncharacterized protein LOC112569254 isoform X2 [Pomacea canaliculata]